MFYNKAYIFYIKKFLKKKRFFETFLKNYNISFFLIKIRRIYLKFYYIYNT